MQRARSFVRNLAADDHLEVFLVSAVAAILGIRFYLELAGYPTIGGESLHISHMLWGGLLMLAALMLLLAFLNREAYTWAAVLGGAGFGTFIDEVGKFVTRDNDYFYRPAAALIYITFILTYLVVRALLRRREFSSDEYLLNALRNLEEEVQGDPDADRRAQTLLYLDRAGIERPLAEMLRGYLTSLEAVARRRPGRARRTLSRVREVYRRFARRAWFSQAVISVFVSVLLVKLAVVLVQIFFPALAAGGADPLQAVEERALRLEFIDVAEGLSLLAAMVFVAAGIARMRFSRLGAYRMFQRSLQVSIFLTQVFAFYREQFSAILLLAVNIGVLATLELAMEYERTAAAEAGEVEEAVHP